MRLVTCFIVLICTNLASANEAQLGVILGSMTGISGKYDLGGDRAIDAALAYSVDGNYGLSLHADYLFNKARTFAIGEASPFSMYYGIGGRLISIRSYADYGKTRVGLRAPVGAYYRTADPRLEIFGEVAAILDFVPRTDVFIDVGLGVRFIF